MGKIANSMKESGTFGRDIYYYLYAVRKFFKYRMYSDKYLVTRQFKENFGYKPDLNNPKTLNEKLQWLKLNDRKDFYTICADKYAVREYLGEYFGKEYLIPLFYETSSWRDVRPENISEFPCIIKSNHDSGHYKIIRDKDTINWETLRRDCKSWLSHNHYYYTQEWHYKNIKPHRIVVEKLLETKEGKIPNDYKLNYINGILQFVYVSFDREGVNDRCTYDADWNRLPFVWVPKCTYRTTMNTSEVPKPATFSDMVKFGNEIANNFKYVRVDFFDVDGKLYFGEITLYHGSGIDLFFPRSYDLVYGEKLKI